MTAHSTGWITAGESRSTAGSPGLAVRMACRSQSAWGASASAQAPIAAAKAGKSVEQVGGHAGPLGALPGEHQRPAAPPPGGTLPVTIAGVGASGGEG